MTALVVLARRMARRQLAGLLLVALVGGLGIGLVIVAATDARRADSAYSRLRAASLAPDGLFGAAELDDGDIARLAALPDVAGIARFSYTPVTPLPLTPGVDGGGFVGFDPDFLVDVYRPVVLKGRLPDPAAADEVVVNEAMARTAHLGAGQRTVLVSGFEDPAPVGTVTVVGVVRGIFDVGANAGNPTVLLGRSFYDAHRDTIQLGPQPAALVRLGRGDAGLPAFQRNAAEALGREISVQFSGSDEARPTERTLRVQTVGLAVLAMAAGLATLAAVGQALNRLLERALEDLPILVAIGVKPRQRVLLGALLAAPVAVVGALVALAPAVLASPRLPTGFAHRVDPLRGVRLDVIVLSLSLLVWSLVVIGGGAVLAWRLARRRAGVVAPGRVRRLVAALPYRVRLGCESALVPWRSAGGAASRAALVAATVSVAAVVAVSSFGASLSHLLHTASLQGWSFDAAIVNGDTTFDGFHRSLASLPDDPAVSRVAWGALVDVRVGGVPVEAYAFEADGEGMHPTMRSGRPPLGDDEIVVGSDILRDGHLSVGDEVVVGGPTGEVPFVVVGSATYPELGSNSDLGTTASLTRGGARRVGAQEHGAMALVRLAPGHGAGSLARYAGEGSELVEPFRPPRVRNLEEIGALPWALAAFASLLGVLAVGHGLWTSIRARRRDLAVLASIGLRPRDIRATLMWQVTCVAIVGATVGGAAGAVLGSRAWSAVATATAVVDRPLVPLSSIVLVAGAALVGCAVVGLVGDRWARHRELAIALRGE